MQIALIHFLLLTFHDIYSPGKNEARIISTHVPENTKHVKVILPLEKFCDQLYLLAKTRLTFKPTPPS